jgi:hypothetical protein
MTRSELLGNREFWINQIQNDLFGLIEEYMKTNKLNRTQLANELKVTKGYVTQVLNGDFDHKISKFVDLSLFSGKVPFINFVDLNKLIKDDKEGLTYKLVTVARIKPLNIEKGAPILSKPKVIRMLPSVPNEVNNKYYNSYNYLLAK